VLFHLIADNLKTFEAMSYTSKKFNQQKAYLDWIQAVNERIFFRVLGADNFVFDN